MTGWLIFVVAGGLALAVWYFNSDRILRRTLASVPLVPIGQVTAGRVRIRGRARATGDLLAAPGTGRRCLAYSVAVYTHDGDGGRDVVANFHDCGPFCVEDDTGRAQVRGGERVRVLTAPAGLRRGHAQARLVAAVRARGIDTTDLWGDEKELRFQEALLVDGDEASVLGYARLEVDPALPTPAPRQLPTSFLLTDRGDGEPLVIGAGDWHSDEELLPFEEREDVPNRRLLPLTLIAAVARNGVIGRDGRLPWNLPEDRAHFERETLGHAVIMGRRTWDETGAPLPGRRNLVISRSGEVTGTGREVYRTLASALEAARTTDPHPFVIGGEDIFRQALPMATRMLLTELDFDAPGDRVFPMFGREEWRVTERRPGDRATYVTYVRV